MADTPTPYVPKAAGDIMLAADWNEMQVRARTELQAHDHSSAPFRQIPREGIRDRAINEAKIDPASKPTLAELTVSGPLRVTGTSLLADVQISGAASLGAPLSVAGHLSIGTNTPENAEGWSRVLDLVGGPHAKLSVRAGAVDARLMSHTASIYGAEPGMLLGTRSPHPLSVITNGSTRLRVSAERSDSGIETPVLDLAPGNAFLRFSSAYTALVNQLPLGAEICNDTTTRKALMLVGNKSSGVDRRVGIWERLDVHGPTFSKGLDVSDQVADHMNSDGCFYRWQGQAYLAVDDNLYIRDINKGVQMHFNTLNGVITSKGINIETEAPDHLNFDGCFYRWQGQAYLAVDDNLYIRDTNTGQVKMHFDTNSGTFKTDVLRLGDKWRLSGIGDHEANDDWLRLKNVANNNYYGGFASEKMWCRSGRFESDERLKENIHEIDRPLERLKGLRGVSYTWKSSGQHASGLLAQEVEAQLPHAVDVGPDGWKGIDPSAVIGLLVQAVKAQQTQIETLQAQLATPTP
ncbi:MAG: tail fiber domain-containing protein [Rhodocyclales bacterium]|nr:tail fiber domain-containing protein [Rhodocyclales bacterium]